MIIAPRNGMIIIDPSTSRPLSPEGEEKELNSYWIRRLNDGDVIEKSEQAPAVAAESRAKK